MMKETKPTLLELRGINKLFGGLTAVSDLDLSVRENEIMGLIGPNGAGKSTALNMIGGTEKVSRGKVFFDGIDITRHPAHRRAKMGISRVFQANVLFNSFTVLDNVLVGFHLKANTSLFRVLFQRKAINAESHDIQEQAVSLLEYVGLEPYIDKVANNLPHGVQRILGLAIAMAVQPRLILLDEPFTGMTDAEVNTMISLVRRLRDEQHITCIIIEHNMKVVMGLCDRMAVLNFGKKIAEGTPGEIFDNHLVTEAYLGTEEDVA